MKHILIWTLFTIFLLLAIRETIYPANPNWHLWETSYFNGSEYELVYSDPKYNRSVPIKYYICTLEGGGWDECKKFLNSWVN